MKKILILFLLIGLKSLAQDVTICGLPQTTTGTMHDLLIKEDSNCNDPNGTKYITVKNFINLIQDSISLPLTVTSPLSIATNTISIDSATSLQGGYLTRWKFNLFNSKESALTFSTGLIRVSNTITLDTSFAETKNHILQYFVPYSGATSNVDLNNKKFVNSNLIAIGTTSTTPITTVTRLQIGDESYNSPTENAISIIGNSTVDNSNISAIFFHNTASTGTSGKRIAAITALRRTNNNGGRLSIGTYDSTGTLHSSIDISPRGRVGILTYPSAFYALDAHGTVHSDSLVLTPVLTATTGNITNGNIATEIVTSSATYSANVIYPTTINSSLSGANARIPSHVYTSITFTNSGLTSIGSANNGGVVDGHFLFIVNGTGGDLTIINNYGSAAAGEAINTGKGGNVTVPNGGTFVLRYDGFASAWSFLGGGSTPITNVTGKTSTGSGLPYTLCFAASDETTALAVDTNAVQIWLPESFTVTSVWGSLNVAQTSGSIFTFDAKLNGTSIFSTKPTIDNTEYTTGTAATSAVLSTTALGSGARLSIYKQQIGNGTAKGLKVCFLGTR